jgi:hypothetical protein
MHEVEVVATFGRMAWLCSTLHSTLGILRELRVDCRAGVSAALVVWCVESLGAARPFCARVLRFCITERCTR